MFARAFSNLWNLGSFSNLHHLDLAMSKFLDLVICELSVLLELSLPNIVMRNTQPEEVIAAGSKCKLLLKLRIAVDNWKSCPLSAKRKQLAKVEMYA